MISLLHTPHEFSLGGGLVHIRQLLKDTLALGHRAACAAFEDGPMREVMEADGIDVFLMNGPEELEDVARKWKANVLHGHTCGGGAYCIPIAHKIGAIGGETVHSMCPGTNEQADFEVVEVHKLHDARPKSTLIYWAFNQERLTPALPRDMTRQTLGIPQDATVVGRNGRLDGSKAPDEFIRALAKLPKCWGLLVGDGPEFPHLQEMAKDLGCSNRLVMPGTRMDPGTMFNAMDIILYPTRDESVCAGVVEPLFLEKPVICYPVGGMDETIIPGQTGLHAGCVTDLVNGVEYLLENPDVARQLGKNGRLHLKMKQQHDSMNEACLHIGLYERCLQEKGLS